MLAEWQHLVHDLSALEIGVQDDSANIQVIREPIADLLIEHHMIHVSWIFVNGIRANLASAQLLANSIRPVSNG